MKAYYTACHVDKMCITILQYIVRRVFPLRMPVLYKLKVVIAQSLTISGCKKGLHGSQQEGWIEVRPFRKLYFYTSDHYTDVRRGAEVNEITSTWVRNIISYFTVRSADRPSLQNGKFKYHFMVSRYYFWTKLLFRLLQEFELYFRIKIIAQT